MTTLMVRPWATIRSFYADLVSSSRLVECGLPVNSMLELVQAIEVTHYASGLFAWTSMFDLCIVQTPVSYPYDGPLLRITPVSEDRIEFRYLDTLDKAKQWHRTVGADQALPRLIKFLDQLRWFRADV